MPVLVVLSCLEGDSLIACVDCSLRTQSSLDKLDSGIWSCMPLNRTSTSAFCQRFLINDMFISGNTRVRTV
jgi:hypothetical protein